MLTVSVRIPLTHKALRLSLWPTVVFLATFSLLVSLGFWQLDRAKQKTLYEKQAQSFRETIKAHKAHTLSLSQAYIAYQEYGRALNDIPLTLRGQFLPEPIVLHDNRILAGRAGYHVLAFFQPEEALQAILINLGWTPWLHQRRDLLPNLTLPQNRMMLTGVLFVPNPEIWTLEKEAPPLIDSSQPWLLQKIDLNLLSEQLNRDLFPFTLRLTPDSKPKISTETNHSLNRSFRNALDWETPIEKHHGYALQWFTMALVFTGLYVLLNLQ